MFAIQGVDVHYVRSHRNRLDDSQSQAQHGLEKEEDRTSDLFNASCVCKKPWLQNSHCVSLGWKFQKHAARWIGNVGALFCNNMGFHSIPFGSYNANIMVHQEKTVLPLLVHKLNGGRSSGRTCDGTNHGEPTMYVMRDVGVS